MSLLNNLFSKLAFTLLLSVFCFNGFSQGIKQRMADKYYNKLAYFKAVELYEDLSSKKKTTDYPVRRTAECYRLIGNAQKAEVWYRRLIMMDGVKPEDHYHYAQMLKVNKRYDEANKQMSKFYELRASNSVAKVHVNAEDYVKRLQSKKGLYKVNNLGELVNTEDSEFAPTMLGRDKLVFVSKRRNTIVRGGKAATDGNYYSDVYQVNVNDFMPEGKVEAINDVNGRYYDGPASFSADGSKMYVTRTNEVNGKRVYSKNKQAKLQLFISEKSGDKWGGLIPFQYNNKEYNIAHATVSKDGKEMFFSSKADGGMGGNDIWKSEKQADGTWGAPENVVGVNTEGDEEFPFISESGTLYFSSNGHLGLGGLDIFKVNRAGGSYLATNVVNMGGGLNTSDDDFGLVLNASEEKGYFSSNRQAEGSTRRDDDIYNVTISEMPVEDSTLVQVSIKDIEFGELLSGVKVEMIDSVTGERFVFFTDSMGVAETKIKTVDDIGRFKITLSRQDYLDKKFLVTSDMMQDGVIRIDEFMQADTGLVNTYCKINQILFDFEKWNIRPDAAAELDKLVKCMQDNPTVVIEIGSHTDCIGPKKYNSNLSSKRAKSSREYVVSNGISAERIFGIGYGEERILNRCECEMPNWRSDCSDEEHQVNRRTEFRLIKGRRQVGNSSNNSFD